MTPFATCMSAPYWDIFLTGDCLTMIHYDDDGNGDDDAVSVDSVHQAKQLADLSRELPGTAWAP